MKQIIYILILLLFFIQFYAKADINNTYSFPENYVWDSSKKYIAYNKIGEDLSQYTQEWIDAGLKAINILDNSSSNGDFFNSNEISIIKKAKYKLENASLKIFDLNYTELSEGFDLNSLTNDSYDCKFRTKSASAYINGINIELCRHSFVFDVEIKVQLLIHEAIHLAGIRSHQIVSPLTHKIMYLNDIKPIKEGEYLAKESINIDFKEPTFNPEIRKFIHPLAWKNEGKKSECELRASKGLIFKEVVFSTKAWLFKTSPLVYPGSLNSISIINVNLSAENDLEKLNVKNKVAIAKRGKLPFSEKMFNAAKAGAKAIIIYDPKSDREFLDATLSNENLLELYDINSLIPVIGLDIDSGKELERLSLDTSTNISIACDF